MVASAVRRCSSLLKIRLFVTLGCALLISAALPQAASAQALYGSIVGVVTDPTGAVVPGVQVTAKNVDTGQTKDDTTDASGRFNLQSLLPGNYSLSMKGIGIQGGRAIGNFCNAEYDRTCQPELWSWGSQPNR